LKNGAAVDLDDSSWQKIQFPFFASSDAVWLRKWIEVPKTLYGYDLTGATIRLEARFRGGVAIYLNDKLAAG
jgi:alpha-mannosidase